MFRIPIVARILLSVFIVSSIARGQEVDTFFRVPVVLAGEVHNFEALADLDGDGDKDIISVWRASNSTALRFGGWFNDGQGKFTQGWEYVSPLPSNLVGRPFKIVPADYNGDGKDDFAFVSEDVIAIRLSIDSATTPLLAWGWLEPTPVLGVVAHDVNQDGREDLLVTRDGEAKLYLMTGAGPVFGSNIGLPFGGIHEVLIAELTGDTVPDLCVAQSVGGATQIIVVRILGTSLLPGQVLNVQTPLTSLMLGDVDGDGDEDLVLHTGTQYVLIRRQGSQVFAIDPPRPADKFTHLADMTNDGIVDAVTVIGPVLIFGPSNSVPAWVAFGENDGTGVFGTFRGYSIMGGTRLAGVDDLDGDGDLDLVCGRCVFYGNTEEKPAFLMPIPLWNAIAAGNGAADFDRDGDPDLVVSLTSRATNFGEGTLAEEAVVIPPPPSMGETYEGPGIPGDFDGDGDVDLIVKVRQGVSVSGMRLLRNLGGGHFADGGPAGAPLEDFCIVPGAQSVNQFAFAASARNSIVADLDGDGDLDIVTRFQTLSNVLGVSRIWRNNGMGFFTPGDMFFDVYARAIRDFTGDSLVDVLGSRGADLRVYPAASPGTYSANFFSIDAMAQAWDAVASGDIDGDGDLDVAMVRLGGLWIYANNGTGASWVGTPIPGIMTSPPASGNPQRVFMADLGGSPLPEVMFGPMTFADNCSAVVSVQSLNPLTFTQSIEVTRPFFLSDQDGDGDLDAVSQSETVWNRRFEPPASGTRLQYGAGLAGTGGMVPVLGDVGPFRPGLSGELRVTGGLGGALGVIAFGSTEANTPIVGGLLHLNPTLYLDVALSGPLGVPGTGSWTLPWTLPPSFAGVTIFHQVGIVDPGAPQGISLTNGLRVTIGL